MQHRVFGLFMRVLINFLCKCNQCCLSLHYFAKGDCKENPRKILTSRKTSKSEIKFIYRLRRNKFISVYKY